MEKNEIVKGQCIDYTADAQGVVKIDGYPLFVKGLMLDEVAELKVTKVNKNYGFATIQKIIEQSKFRRFDPCKYADLCGGCQIQYMEQRAQSEMKHRTVSSMMQRIAKVDIEVEDIVCTNEFYYRNRTQIPVQVIDGKVHMGFYKRNSNDSIDMDECMIQDEVLNEVYKKVKGILVTHIELASQLRHVLFKYAGSTDQIMIVLVTRVKKVPDLQEFVQLLVSLDTRIESVVQNINQRNDSVILGEEEVVLYNQDYIEDSLLGLKFKISSKSFYQVNSKQTEFLYNKAIEFANIKKNERVLDLYCGIGTISLAVSNYAKEVVGVEIVDEAIKNAKANARYNNISNVNFICSDATSYAKQVKETSEHFDVIIVDPPRKGLDQSALESICIMNPSRIIYVSCDPSTLARDIQRLGDSYELIKVQPVDMFPNTYHVEAVALLKRY